MGWSSGSRLAETLWSKLVPFIKPNDYKKVSKIIMDEFTSYDADDWELYPSNDCLMYVYLKRMNLKSLRNMNLMKKRQKTLTKVYIVRFGEYSDQGIAAVFSSEEKAKRYCDINNEIDEMYENYWIDDRILDEEEIKSDAKVVTYYCACISLKDDKWNKAGQIYSEDEYKQVYTSPVVIERADDYVSVKSTTSLEHAKKVAIEQYQIYTQQKLEEEIIEK